MFKRSILSVLLATIWISISEFFRNEILLKSYWTTHYQNLGLVFPAEPVNGAVWGLWSLFLAIFIFLLSRRFSFRETIFLAWFSGFVLMWIVIGNLNVLPFGLLLYAVPLSLLEVFLAAFIIDRISKPEVQS